MLKREEAQLKPAGVFHCSSHSGAAGTWVNIGACGHYLLLLTEQFFSILFLFQHDPSDVISGPAQVRTGSLLIILSRVQAS